MPSRKASEVQELVPSGSTQMLSSPARRQQTLLEQNHQGTGTCSLSYSGCFELAIFPLFLSQEAFHPHTLQNFCSLSSSFFCVFFLFLRSISLQVFQSFFEDAQRHKDTPCRLHSLIISRIWLRTRSAWAREPVAQHQEPALACECTGACHGTTEWSRADNLWGPREDRFLFLYWTCLSL